MRRRSKFPHYNAVNGQGSTSSKLLRRILCSPIFMLLIIVALFIVVGVLPFEDMRRIRPDNSETHLHDKDDSGDPEIIGGKPLRITVTFATNIDPHRTYLFLSSYRQWHPESERSHNKLYHMYLFTHFAEEKYLPEVRRLTDHFGVHLVDMDPIASALDSEYMELLDIRMKFIKINKRRFFILFHWLKSFENADDIDAIFISDANDVKFQGNIFSLYDLTMEENRSSLSLDDEIFWFFMENPDAKMDGEKWNRRYIKYCFGNESIALYHDLHVSCSGTSLGTYQAMYYYLEEMNRILVEQGQLFHDCLRKPGDQGIHNHILHREVLLDRDPDLKVIRIPNDSGWVLQITTMINHPVWSKQVPEMAKEAVVVHQWKWARTLKDKFENEYNYGSFCEQQEWSGCTVKQS